MTTNEDAVPIEFADLVYAHGFLARARQDGEVSADASDHYALARARFERTYGSIAEAFWTKDGYAGAVLTEGRRGTLGGLLGRETPPKLHVEQEWLSRSPRASELQNRCLELAIRASVLLGSTSRRIAMLLLFNILARALELVDSAATSTERAGREQTFGQLERELRDAREYIERASEKYAQLRYVEGMAASLVVVAIAALVADVAAGWARPSERLTVAIVGGACGAVISVLQRFGGGRLRLPADLDRRQLLGAGASRALVGAVFGAIVYFVYRTKIVVVLPDVSTRIPVYALSGFLAGFAERFVSVLYAEGARFGADEVAERIPVAVEESVRATLLGPTLARWHGFVSVSVDADETADGVAHLEPLEPAQLSVRFGQEETGGPFERPIDLHEGEDAASVPFALRLESDTVSTPAADQRLDVPAGGGAALSMPLTAPKAPGRHQLWLRVSQRNRVVQMVPFALEVDD
jgi:hypothetical protein